MDTRIKQKKASSAIALDADFAKIIVSMTPNLRAIGGQHKGLDADTVRQYRKDSERVRNAGDNVLAIAGSKASFYKLRAARCFDLAFKIREAMLNADRVRKAQGVPLESCPDAMAYYRDVIFPAVHEFRQIRSQKWDPTACAKGHRSTKQRHKLGRMPEDWRERIYERMHEGKYGTAVALGLLTGLRPAEVSKAVWTIKKGELVIKIYGAKVKDKGNGKAKGVEIGQEFRGLFFKLDDLSGADRKAFLLLASKMDKTTGMGSCGDDVTAKGLSSAFRAASAREFSEMKSPPSFYVLRHAMSANLKSQELPPEAIAKALGHRSTLSATAYGQKQQAGKGGGPKVARVAAASAVRVVPPTGKPPSTGRRAKPKPKL